MALSCAGDSLPCDDSQFLSRAPSPIYHELCPPPPPPPILLPYESFSNDAPLPPITFPSFVPVDPEMHRTVLEDFEQMQVILISLNRCSPVFCSVRKPSRESLFGPGRGKRHAD